MHRYGTVFTSGVDLSMKKLGIGVMNGFIGGCSDHMRVILGDHLGVINRGWVFLQSFEQKSKPTHLPLQKLAKMNI